MPAVDDASLAGVDDDEGQVYGCVWSGRSLVLMLRLTIALHQVFKGDLLQIKRNQTTIHPHEHDTYRQQEISCNVYITAAQLIVKNCAWQ